MMINRMSRAPLLLLLAALAACNKGDKANVDAKAEAVVGTNTEAAVEASANAAAGVSANAAAGASANAAAGASANAAAGVDANANVNAAGEDAVVEEHEGGALALNIGADGNVKAAVTGTENKPIRDNINASLVWKSNEDTKTIPLTLDAQTGLLVGAGPKLDGDLTEVNYTVNVDSKPWTGTIYLPAGGTAAIVASAKESTTVEVPIDKPGPNGGVIQVVGNDRVELVSDESSGEVRAYVLDADLHPVPVGERTITLGIVAETPRTYVLERAEGGAYFVARAALAVDPLRITIAVRDAGRTHVALVGYRPGMRLVVGARAPRLRVHVKTNWVARADLEPDVDVRVHGHGEGRALGHYKDREEFEDHGHGGVHSRAGAKVDVHVSAPEVRVHAPSVEVKAHAGVHAGGKAGGKGKGH